MSEPKHNRRQLKRVMKRLPAAFTGRMAKAQGHVSRLSRKGLFFATETLPTPGELVRVAFLDHDGNKIKVNGTVRWTTAQERRSASGFGMEIEDPPEAYLDFYETILTS